MHVTIVQYDITWEDKAASQAAMDAMLAEHPPVKGGLVLLPELGDVGFSFNIDRIKRVLERDEDLQTGAIFSNPTDDDIKMAEEMGVCGVGVHFKNLRLKTVEQAMIALGVSGVGTNRPDILMEYLKLT